MLYDVLSPAVYWWREKKILKLEPELEQHYQTIINSIRNRTDKRIRFGSYVMYDSDYGMDSAFQIMKANPEQWSPKVVIIPDVSRGKEHALQIYQRTKAFFLKKYGREYVLDGWDLHSRYYDYLSLFDVVYYNNPYDQMAHKYHKICYGAKQNVLPIYVTYGYEISSHFTYLRYQSTAINLFWKCYTDTRYSYRDYQKYQIRKGRNVTLSGYSKMDSYAAYSTEKSKKRKKILISPHHTVVNSDLPLSNFLRFYKLILRLPEMFPDVDFIFRPHPLLFTTLINYKIWSKQQADAYLRRLKELHIEYSEGGDYFEVFQQADAIINDSGSFTIEWLFTGKPGCFVRNPQLKAEQLTVLMRKALTEYTIAESEADIIRFISSVAESEAPASYTMKDWVRKNIAVNYPHAAEAITDDILKEIFY